MAIFAKRVRVWQETLQLIDRLPLPPPATKYKYSREVQPLKLYKNCVVTVWNADTIFVGTELLRYGSRPVLLNLGDDKVPGGCVESGSGAQEESLCRCTNYIKSLDTSFYPLDPDEGIYSPCVTVLRASEEHGWAWLSKPYQIDFVCVPGLYFPRVENGRLTEADVRKLKTKINLILQIACTHNHDSVVLGALGCGAWANPPEHVAEIFKEVLQEWDGCFRVVIFAILDTTGDNYIGRRNNNFFVFNSVIHA